MRRLYTSVYKLLCAATLLFTANTVQAQTCPVLNLPDTLYMCKNTTVAMPVASITGISSGLLFLDTLWTPNTSLTNPRGIITNVLVSTNSRYYTLTVRSFRDNIAPNPSFEGGNTGFTSDYFPGGTTIPGPGFWAITSSPSAANPTFSPCVPPTTGGGGSNMFVVDGSGNVNQAVIRKTIAAQPNSWYRIRTEATSLTNVNPAQLQYEINGTLSGPLLNLTNITCQWTPLEYFYYNAAATTLTVGIRDLVANTAGNDFALDSFVIQPMCLSRDSIYVNVANLSPTIKFTTRKGCKNDTVDFRADTLSFPGLPATWANGWQWDFGDGTTSTLTNPTHIYPAGGRYTVRLNVTKTNKNYDGNTIVCSDSAIGIVDNLRPFHAGFIQDKDSICMGEEVSFTDTSFPTSGIGVKYYFGTGDSSLFESPRYTYDTAGVFQVVQVVTNQVGCTDTARNTVVSIGQPPVLLQLSDTVVCLGQSIIAQSPSLDPSFRNTYWDFDDGRIVRDTNNVRHSFQYPGTFDVTFHADHSFCPPVEAVKQVEVLPTPLVNLGRDTSICVNGQPIIFQNLLSNQNAPDTRYLWNTGDATPSLLVRHEGTFYLTVSNALGCNTTDTITVTKNCFLDVPNAFTPDADGNNDYFFPRQFTTKGLASFKMKIYNRWGQVIYETERTDGRGWDGKFNGEDQPVGVYLYFIEAKFENGQTEKYDGNLTLIR